MIEGRGVKVLMVSWAAIWLFLVILLYWKWHSMPRPLAWILALAEALLVPNTESLKLLTGNSRNQT